MPIQFLMAGIVSIFGAKNNPDRAVFLNRGGINLSEQKRIEVGTLLNLVISETLLCTTRGITSPGSLGCRTGNSKPASNRKTLKKVLIISPYFPPFNTADMQRVRQSLPYLRENGWEPTVLTVDEKYVEAYSVDDLLLQTIPHDITVHKVNALKASITRRLGIGSLSIRAFFSMRKKGDELLRTEKFDLVYFSTTAFHVMALGPRWKRKFGVPFILDIQDPWYNTFYFSHALTKKTPKAWMYHQLDKHLEARTLPYADGIISVSSGYRDLYLKRYPGLAYESFRIIPFGCAVLDFPIAKKNISRSSVSFSTDEINAVYIGRGGQDMEFAAGIIFDAVRLGRERQPELFKKLRLWAIGTSYAQAGKGAKTFEPVARQKGLDGQVTEISDRLPYFETLHLLSKADLLFVPGSIDSTYTASKIYPYIYMDKPMLSVFHEKSSVCEIIRHTSKSKVATFGDHVTAKEKEQLAEDCYAYLSEVLRRNIKDANLNRQAFEEYTARSMAVKQIDFFNQVINHIA